MTDLFDAASAATPVLGILRGFSPARTVALCRIAWSVGARLVEVPIQDDSAIASLEAATNAARAEGREVGAGTVTTVERVRIAHALGAAFTVAPGYDPAVARASREAGMPHLPGVATASEVQRAMADGHRWLKAFPAAELGTGWLRAMRGPFPDARFVATGGVDRSNAADFLSAGARLVAVGQAVEGLDESWNLNNAIEERT